MDVDGIAPGLWRWTAPHPDWTPEEEGPEGWPQDVGCIYYEASDAVILIDPLVPPDRERFWNALDRDIERAGLPVAVLLTVFWHERSAHEVVDRYPGASLWAHEHSLARLAGAVTNPFRPGEVLPGGVQAFEANRRDEVLYWLPDQRALVAGDVLLGAEGGEVRVCPDSWLPEGVTPGAFRESLRPLLELPIERVLVSHGTPVLANGHAALARALGAHSPPSA